MSQPLVSVIIPAYNCGLWVCDAISSALQQQLVSMEVIVVNDGSTDDTVARVNALSDARVRLISHENRGHSAATNTGIELATGRYVKLLDADDILSPGHIHSQLRAIKDFPGCVACCRWGYFIDNPAKTLPRPEATDRDFPDPLEWLVTSLTEDEGMMGGCRWLIPREVLIRAGGYTESLSLNNDFDFSIRVLLASDGVRYAEGALYCYRKGVSSALSQSRGLRAMTSAFETTRLGIQSLLSRENSPRIRRICADRMQTWIYEFFPEFPHLVVAAESIVQDLGGSTRRPEGGRLFRTLTPLLGWKMVRHLQLLAGRLGWARVQRWKRLRRLKELR